MAEDIQSNIRVNIDTNQALANIKLLQRELSAFHTSFAKGSATAVAASRQFQQELINDVNATGKFSAQFKTVKTSTESFTTALEKNKLSMGEYFRYAGGASRSFGKLFKTEFDTINKVARERVKDLQTQYIKMGRDANGAMKAIAIRPLTLDMESLGTKTAIAAQKQALLNQLLKQGSTNLLNFGKNTQWAGRQLMIGFTIPLTMLGTAAAKTFMDMEKQAIAFKRVYGDMLTTSSETEKALKDVQNLAVEFTKYGVAVADTMELAAKAAATGKTGADLIAQVSQATRLSVLGGVDQQQALEATISLTDAFGTSADALAGKINFLNAVENQTVTSIEDLTIAIPKAGPVVKQLGGNVEDLTFFLTAMREGGINASEGANALKSGLASMINPTAKASEFLAGFGVNLKGIVEANKGDVKSTVIEFAKALDTLDPLNRARAIEQLFGKFQFSRISTLFKNVIDEGTQAGRVLELTNTSNIQLAALSQKELQRISESPMFKFQKAVEDLKKSLAPVGEEFLKAVTPLINFGTDVLKKFNDLDSGAKAFITNLIGGLGVVGPVALMTFGLLANGIANLIKGFVFIKNVFNRAGTASTELGQQTAYMSAAQIEASAVAASLNQTHSKLIQTFNLEAGALNSLTTAYNRSLSSMSAFTGVPRGTGKSTKKFAAGGMVPGSGSGDIVPSLLTPGEFVVNKKAASQNMLALNALNSGKISRFARGGRVGSGPSGRVGKSLITLPIDYKTNVSNQSGALNMSDITPDAASLSYMYADEILKQSKTSAGAVSREIIQWEQINKKAIDEATNAVNAGTPAAEAFKDLSDKFVSDMESANGPVKKFSDTARSMLPQIEADFREAQAAANSMGLNLRSGADTAKLAEKMPNNLLAQGMNTPGNFGRLSRVRGAAAQIFGGGSKNFGKTGTPAFMMTKGLDTKSIAYGTMMTQEHIAVTKLQEENRKALAGIRTQTTKFAQAVPKETVSAIEEVTRQASPSKEAYNAGANIGIGAINGIKSTQGQAVTAGESLATATQSGARRASQGQTNYDLLNLPMQGPAKPTFRQKVGSKISSGIRSAANMKVGDLSGGKLAGLGAAASMATFALSGMGGTVGQVANAILPVVSIFSLLGPLLTGFAASLGLASLPLLPIIAGLAGLAAVVGVSAFAINQANEAKKKELEQINASADAYKYATKAVSEFATLSGTATKPTLMDLSKESFKSDVTGKNLNDIQTLLASDEFTNPESQIFKMITALKKTTDVQAKAFVSAYAQQLVASGIGEAEVDASIKAIQSAAGKKDLNIDFASVNINTKTGRENLLKSIEEATSNITKNKKLKRRDGTTVLDPIATAKRTADVKSAASALSFSFANINSQFSTGAISGNVYNSMISGITKSLKGMTDQALAGRILKTMFSDISPAAASFAAGFDSMTDKVKIFTIVSLAGADALASLQDSFARMGPIADPKQRASLIKYTLDKSLKDAKAFGKAFDKITGTGSTGTGSGTGGTVANTSALEKQLDTLKKKLESLRSINAELKRQQDFEMAQQKRIQDMKQDFISGNYLAASMKRQEMAYAQQNYNKESETISLEKKISDLEARIAAKKNTGRASGGMVYPGMAMGGLISGPGTGTSDSITAKLNFASGGQINVSNGEYITRAASVRQYGTDFMNSVNNGSYNPGAYSGDSVYNVNMTINGGNANADQIASAVMKKLDVIATKNNKTNKVRV